MILGYLALIFDSLSVEKYNDTIMVALPHFVFTITLSTISKQFKAQHKYLPLTLYIYLGFVYLNFSPEIVSLKLKNYSKIYL